MLNKSYLKSENDQVEVGKYLENIEKYLENMEKIWRK